MQKYNTKRHAFIVISIFAILIICLSSSSHLVRWDANAYLGNARSLIGESKYVEDFRPPLLELLIAGLWLFTGESIIAAKILAIVFSVAAASVFYFLCREFLGRKASLLALTLFCANYLIIDWGPRIYTDTPSMLLVLLGFYILIKHKGIQWSFLSGAVLGAAFLMRFVTGLMFGLVMLYLAYEYIRTRKLSALNRLLANGLGFIVVISPWLIYNKIQHGNFLWQMYRHYNMVDMVTPDPVTIQLLNISKILGPILLFTTLGIYLIIKKKELKLYVPAAFFIAYTLYVTFFVNVKLERYVLPAVPFAILIAVFSLGLFKKKKRKIAILTSAAIMLIFTLIMTVSHIMNTLHNDGCQSEGSIMQSIDFIASEAGPQDVIASNIWPYFGHYNNLESHSLWTKKVNKYYERYRARFIIHQDTQGAYFDRSLLDQSEQVRLIKTIEACDGKASIYETTPH